MKSNFNYKNKPSPIDDPQDTIEYWRKLAPKIWTSKASIIKALKRFENLKKVKNLSNKKSLEAKIQALKELLN